MVGGFQAGGTNVEPGESLYVPLAIGLGAVTIKSYGAHDVWVAIDGGSAQQLTFYVTHFSPPQQQ